MVSSFPWGRLILAIVALAAVSAGMKASYDYGYSQSELAAEKRHSEALRQANEQWQLRMDEALEAQERLMSEIGRIETKAKVIYEQIPVHISPEKSVYCAPTADTIRLLEHARATGSMPSASAIVDAERATPSDFSYTDFVLSYAELAVRYNRLRARNNQLIDWVASNGRPDSADTD